MNNILEKISFTFFLIIIIVIIFIVINYIYNIILHKLYPINLKVIRKNQNKYILPSPVINKSVPPGFIGGGLGYNSLPGSKEWDSIPMLGNHDRDTEPTRMMRAWWPEFSWDSQTDIGMLSKMFQQDLSRIAYTNTGEICSIICPQFGEKIPILGNIKTEVTVTHVKGWVNETNKTMHAWAKMKFKIWMNETEDSNKLVDVFHKLIKDKNKIPLSKQNAINIPLYSYDKSGNIVDYLEFTNVNRELNIHPKSWMISHVSGFGGYFKKSNYKYENEIYNIILYGVNLFLGNAFATGNTLYWDIYLSKPELINQKEYLNHVNIYSKSEIRFCDWSCGKGHGTPIVTEYGYNYDKFYFIPNYIYYLLKSSISDIISRNIPLLNIINN